MKFVTAAVALSCLAMVNVGQAEAKGCIKGAIVGGIGGKMLGHGGAGAAAGCAIGHHRANKASHDNAPTSTGSTTNTNNTGR